MDIPVTDYMCKRVIVEKYGLSGEFGTITGIDNYYNKFLVDFEKGGSEWLSIDEFKIYDESWYCIIYME